MFWDASGLTLLRFHAAVGARVALRSFAVLFCAFIAAIMLQVDPAGTVAAIALGLFSDPPSSAVLLMIAALAFLLPAWAAPRVSLGVNGWMRHLPLSDGGNRRGLELSLLIVQFPVVLAIAIFALVARNHGAALGKAIWLQLAVLLSAGAFAALPVRRRWLVLPIALLCGLAAALGSWPAALVSLPALVLCEIFAGPVRTVRRRRRARMFFSFSFGIAWRALGWRLFGAYAAAALPLLASDLFVANNDLRGDLEAGAYRLGFSIGILVLMVILSRALAVRRPPWPWARSLPWSSGRRVLDDALVLALHAAPLAAAGAVVHPEAAMAAAALIPLLALRAAAFMRSAREKRAGLGSFVAEGVFSAGLISLLAWTAVLGLAAAPAAFYGARSAECRLKVTRWLESHHLAAGDTLTWSE